MNMDTANMLSDPIMARDIEEISYRPRFSDARSREYRKLIGAGLLILASLGAGAAAYYLMR